MRNQRRYHILLFFMILLLLHPNVSIARKNKKVLDTPSNLIVSNISETNITLTWNSVKNTSSYIIYYRLEGDKSFSIAGTSYSTSYIHNNLTPETTYEYYVEAYNKFDVSNKSNIVKATTNSTIETQPSEETEINTINVLGYATYYYNGDQASLDSMKNNNNLIDETVTHTYSTDGYGNLSGIVPIEQIEYAKNNGIKIFASVTNSFKGEISNQVLSNPINRKNLINNIKSELVKYGFDGVNMDMEGIYYYDREYYSLFIKELYELLSPLEYEVSVAVPAKTYDNPTNSWNGAFDYIALGNYSDKIILMTYDEHFGGGTAGPIASIGWVEQVIDYAITTIPKEKIMLGLAAYGYDWSSNPYRAYGVSKCYDIAYDNGATIIWDSVSQSPYYNYTDSNGIYHTVWFENEYSIEFKLRLVNNYGIDGIAIWRLGLENPAYWNRIATYKN